MVEVLYQIVPSLIVAIVVGMGTGWLATQKALAAYAERLKAAEDAIRSMDQRITDHRAIESARAMEMIEKVTRVETKIDIFIQRIDSWKTS